MNPWKGLGALPRSVWVMFTATLVNRAGTMVLPFLVLYLTRSLGFSAARAGLALTVFGLGALVVGPLAGRLCDTIGALRVVEASLLVSGVFVMFLPMAHGYAAILPLILVWSITSEAGRPASMTVMTELVPPHQRRTVIALNRLAINLGMSVGPAAGGFLAMVSFPALFIADGATSILAGMVILLSRRRWADALAPFPDPQPDTTATPSMPPRRTPLADPRLAWFLAALVPVLMVFFQHQAGMPLHLVHRLGMSEAAFGLLFTLNTALIILIEVPLNNATTHWPLRRSLSLGAALIGVGFGLMMFARGYASVACTVVVWTFGEMILLPSSTAYVAEIAPPSRRGVYMGFYTMTFAAAFTVGPLLGASVMERYGPVMLWGAALVFGSISALMMSRVYVGGSPPAHADVTERKEEAEET